MTEKLTAVTPQELEGWEKLAEREKLEAFNRFESRLVSALREAWKRAEKAEAKLAIAKKAFADIQDGNGNYLTITFIALAAIEKLGEG